MAASASSSSSSSRPALGPTIAAPPARPLKIGNEYAFHGKVIDRWNSGSVTKTQDAFREHLNHILASEDATRRNRELTPLGLKVTKDPRGNFQLTSADGSSIVDFTQLDLSKRPVTIQLKRVSIDTPPFIDSRIEFNRNILTKHPIINNNPDLEPDKKQMLFKAHLEDILSDPSTKQRDAALKNLGLKAEIRDFRGVESWHIEHIDTKPGWWGNNIKQGWVTGHQEPIAIFNGQPLVRVSADAKIHRAKLQDGITGNSHSRENLQAIAKQALDDGRMMDMGEKGAYVLLPDISSVIIIPSGNEDGLDYSKIEIYRVMDSTDGTKITNITTLKIIAETFMDCQSEIEKAAGNGNFWITFNKDINGQLVIKAIRNPNNEQILDLNDIENGGESVDIKGELQKAYANRMDKGCSGKPKEKKADRRSREAALDDYELPPAATSRPPTRSRVAHVRDDSKEPILGMGLTSTPSKASERGSVEPSSRMTEVTEVLD